MNIVYINAYTDYEVLPWNLVYIDNKKSRNMHTMIAKHNIIFKGHFMFTGFHAH